MYVYPVIITIVSLYLKKSTFCYRLLLIKPGVSNSPTAAPHVLKTFWIIFLYSMFPTCELFSTQIEFRFELLYKVTVHSKVFVFGSAKPHILVQNLPNEKIQSSQWSVYGCQSTQKVTFFPDQLFQYLLANFDHFKQFLGV